MERVVAGGAASDAYFINTLSMSDGRDMQLRFQWVGGCARTVRLEERPETDRQ